MTWVQNEEIASRWEPMWAWGWKERGNYDDDPLLYSNKKEMKSCYCHLYHHRSKIPNNVYYVIGGNFQYYEYNVGKFHQNQKMIKWYDWMLYRAESVIKWILYMNCIVRLN
jgi:hypothetical protein